MQIRVVCFTVLVSMGCGPHGQSELRERWGEASDPARLGLDPVNYRDVRSEARLLDRAWSGSYWPLFRGGIGQRWQERVVGIDHRDYLYTIPDQDEVALWSEERLATLSAAEKWDLVANSQRLPLTRWLRQRVLNEANQGVIPR